ncbi:hypothetical protein BDP27DRAFT_1363467 [Rhodocollybia butyracea]|uniref:Uncharacterized protein n=1 Tax=Rhodocollybia butyracea TaxID=206335 RepID=A0A9P5U7Y7_9AGAR|nr:hypothetical protein BDP27DRAFT_1363467 [Rhodocollybia butyracea]
METALLNPALDGAAGIAMKFVQPATFIAEQYQALRRERDYVQEDAKRFKSIQSTLGEDVFTEYDECLQRYILSFLAMHARAAISEFNSIIREHKAMKFNFKSPLEKIGHRKKVRASKRNAVKKKDILSNFVDIRARLQTRLQCSVLSAGRAVKHPLPLYRFATAEAEYLNPGFSG